MNTNFLPNTLKVAIIVGNGYGGNALESLLESLKEVELKPYIISERLGKITADNGDTLNVDATFLTTSPVLYDGLLVVGGDHINDQFAYEAGNFITEQFNHYKPIGGMEEGATLIQQLGIANRPGVFISQSGSGQFTRQFIDGMAKQRFWDR